MKAVPVISAAILFYTTLSTSASSDQSSVVGVWKLVGFERKIVETGKIEKNMGDRLTGFIIYTSGGHYSAILYGSDRANPASSAPTSAEAFAWFQTTIASYAGTYSVDGQEITYHVKAAWNPLLVGTDQHRHFLVDGPHLTIETAPSKSSVDGLNSIRYLRCEKVE